MKPSGNLRLPSTEDLPSYVMLMKLLGVAFSFQLLIIDYVITIVAKSPVFMQCSADGKSCWTSVLSFDNFFRFPCFLLCFF